MAAPKEPEKTNIVKEEIKGKIASTASKATSTAIKTGVKAATKAVATAIGAAGETTNAVLPVIGHAIAVALSWVADKVINKVVDFFDKHKEALLVSAAVVGGMTFGIPALTVTGIVAGLFLWFIGPGVAIATFLGTIAFSFVSFLLAVVLILFIINSGAYVVPGTSIVTGPYSLYGEGNVVCSKEKGPMTRIPTNNTSNPTAYRAWQIVADLYQGFWCFWNRPPLNPPGNSNFPNDVTLYPPNYPSLFDVGTYLTNPNIDPQTASQSWNILFWCTSLVWKAYTETTGWQLCQGCLGVGNMQAWFIKNGRFTANNSATPSNIPPGSIIFFGIPGSTGMIMEHVAIVYKVDSTGITFVQSNAGVKEDFLSWKFPGSGANGIYGFTVTGFGLP